jgi:hypothetical protein
MLVLPLCLVILLKFTALLDMHASQLFANLNFCLLHVYLNSGWLDCTHSLAFRYFCLIEYDLGCPHVSHSLPILNFFFLLLLLDLICIQFCSIEHIDIHFIFSLIVHTHGMYRYQNLWWNVSCMVALTCSTDACTLIGSQMLTEFCLLNQLFLKQSALDQIYKQHFSVCHSNSSLNYIFRFWYTYTNLDIHVLLLVFYYYYHFLSA